MSIEPSLLMTMLAIFVAATLQSATGVGFGIIAGPVLLAFLNDASAVQISIGLNLLIAVLLARSVWPLFDRRIMPGLISGVLIGSIFGFALFIVLPLTQLKVLAGILVLISLIMLLYGDRLVTKNSQNASAKVGQIGAGFFGGVMGASLAMPGPVPAAWMAMVGLSKDVIRASILVMFLFAYLTALLLQVFIVGISTQTMLHSTDYIGPTVIGVLVGRFLSTRTSEQVFRKILIVVLILTAAALFSSIYGFEYLQFGN